MFTLYHYETAIGDHTSMDNACDACELCVLLGYSNLTIVSSDGLKMWHWN